MKKTMKRFIYLLFILAVPLLTKAAATEFTYDPIELNREFKSLNEISERVDSENLTNAKIMSAEDLYVNIKWSSDFAAKPTLNMDEMDWGAFAWGFCCWPVGVFTVLVNEDKDKNSKNSFFVGWASRVIASTVAYVAVYAVAISSMGF